MKAFLMYRGRDFNLKRLSPPNEQALVQDLELPTLLAAMARGDAFILEVARKALLTGAGEDADTVTYRQKALRDCLNNPETVRKLYALVLEAFQREKSIYYGLWREYPNSVLQRSVAVVQLLIGLLKRLRSITDQSMKTFNSEAFLTLFAMLRRELNDEYFKLIDEHLARLKFRNGVLISAQLGAGLKGKDYVIRRPNYEPLNWRERLAVELADLSDLVMRKIGKPPSSYTLHLAPRDEQGARAMSELRDRGVALAADALAQCAEHMLSFFTMLRTELSFYIGCVNLRDKLLELDEHLSFPTLVSNESSFSCKDLYDVCLALSMNQKVVANDMNADNKKLIVITGANQGGKSTFLRSVGLAQLMLQCGMFVPAAHLRANLVDGIFTHYKREEDSTMKSGKFDEELARMNEIASQITPRAMILFNESFAATNEREGSEVARQIVSALMEKEYKLVFVTHLFEFAIGVFAQYSRSGIFLRADRREDGRRTFKLVVGEPLQTSFGGDLYRQVFHDDTPLRTTNEVFIETTSSVE
jgi:MutS domain V